MLASIPYCWFVIVNASQTDREGNVMCVWTEEVVFKIAENIARNSLHLLQRKHLLSRSFPRQVSNTNCYPSAGYLYSQPNKASLT